MMKSVANFTQVTWRIHVRILRPVVVREKCVPVHTDGIPAHIRNKMSDGMSEYMSNTMADSMSEHIEKGGNI